MNKTIELSENMELVERIILNGIVDLVETGDENYVTVGIKTVTKIPTFSGVEVLDKRKVFALTKEMADKIGWKTHWAKVMFVTGKEEIDPTKVEDIIIQLLYGNVECVYSHRYSELTGYLWTDEDFIVGGHNLYKILKSHIGEYIHLEIELYKKGR